MNARLKRSQSNVIEPAQFDYTPGFAAQIYADLYGYIILPLHSVDHDNPDLCTCGNFRCRTPGKHPRIKNWVQKASGNLDTIRYWFHKWPNSNIGILTGKINNIVVLDVDDVTAFQQLGKVAQTIEKTASVRTQRGFHYYFRFPEGASNIRGGAIAKGIDLKADRGYIVAPPSIHAGGLRYKWTAKCYPSHDDIAEYPEWILRGIREKRIFSHVNGKIHEGNRHNHLMSFGGKLVKRGVSEVRIAMMVDTQNKIRCVPPLEEDEVGQIIASCSKYARDEKNSIQNEQNRINKELFDVALPVDEFMKKMIKVPKTYLDPFLCEGSITEIYAERGVGKTFLSLVIAIALTRENLDDENVRIGPWRPSIGAGVLYLDGEMNPFEMRQRIHRLTKPFDGAGNPESAINQFIMLNSIMIDPKLGSFDLGESKWRSGITNLLRKKGCKVLIIDNVSSLTPGIDENSKKEWGPVNQWMLKLRGMGFGIIFIHHAGKGGTQRGTSAREDNIDNVIKLTKASEHSGAHFNVKFEKNRIIRPNIAGMPNKLNLSVKIEAQGRDEDRWVIGKTEIETKQRESMNSLKNRIIARLVKRVRNKNIAAELDCTPQYVSNTKRGAVKKGYLDEKGVPTNKGRQFAGRFEEEDFAELE